MSEVLLDESLLFGSKFSEDEVLEVHLRRLFRADAEPVADETVAEVLEQAGHAVVAAGAAGDGDFDEAEVDREIVVDGDDRGGRHLVEPGQRRDGASAVVHERQRLDEPARAAGRGIPARDLRLKLRRRFPRQAVFLAKASTTTQPRLWRVAS